MEIYYKHKIMLLKEEGDTSHVCQAYDQEVAKADKRSMRSSLAFVRKTSSMTKGVVDGWQLILVALAMVRELSSDTWVYSFTKVNLHPHHRVSFVKWCKRISHFLQGGESFKTELVEVDAYSLLPGFWHGFTTEQKKRAFEIYKKYENTFSVDCVRELTGAQGLVQLADMQSLRTCLDLAAENPDHLERGLPEKVAAKETAEMAAAASNVDIRQGLTSFLLHPKKADGTQLYTGMEKFDHLVKLARRCTPREQVLAPSARLNCEYTAEQQRLLDPSAMDYSMQQIGASVFGESAKKNLAKRKLDALGNIRGECGWANDEKRLKRLKNTLELATSIAEINKITASEKAQAQSESTLKLIELVPGALQKLGEKDGDVAALTIPQMKALAFVRFNGVVLKGNKDAHVAALKKLIEQQPGVLNTPAPAPAPSPASDPVAPMAPAVLDAPGDKSESEAEESESEGESEDESEEHAEEEGLEKEDDDEVAAAHEGGAEEDGEEDDGEEEEEYVIKCILEQRGYGRGVEYLVEWQGYDGETTWESASTLKETVALEDWKKKRKQK